MAKVKRSVAINIMVSEEERGWLDELADRYGMSVSAMVRWLVRRAVYGNNEPALYEGQSAGEAVADDGKAETV